MNDTERRSRHARSMALYDTAINLGWGGTFFGILGMAYWPSFIVSVVFLIAAKVVSKRADKVSPYTAERTK